MKGIINRIAGTLFVGALLSVWAAGAGSWEIYDSSSGLINESVNMVDFNADGTTFVATDGGLDIFDGSWHNFHGTNSPLQSGLVTSIAADDSVAAGSVWVGTKYEGLFRYTGSAWEAVPLSGPNGSVNRVNTIFVDEELDLVFVGANYTWDLTAAFLGPMGLFLFDGSTWTNLYYTNQWGIPMDIGTIARDPADGDVWMYLHDNVFMVYDAQSHAVSRRSIPYLADDQSVSHFAFFPNGDKWFAQNGVLVFFDGTAHTNSYAAAAVTGTVKWIAPDADLQPIIAHNGGVSYYTGNAWNLISTADGLPGGGVRHVYGDPSRRIWISTGEGLAVYTGARILPEANALMGSQIYCVSENNDFLLLGTDIGFVRYHKETRYPWDRFTTAGRYANSGPGDTTWNFSSSGYKLSNNTVRHITVDSFGKTLIATDGGLHIWSMPISPFMIHTWAPGTPPDSPCRGAVEIETGVSTRKYLVFMVVDSRPEVYEMTINWQVSSIVWTNVSHLVPSLHEIPVYIDFSSIAGDGNYNVFFTTFKGTPNQYRRYGYTDGIFFEINGTGLLPYASEIAAATTNSHVWLRQYFDVMELVPGPAGYSTNWYRNTDGLLSPQIRDVLISPLGYPILAGNAGIGVYNGSFFYPITAAHGLSSDNLAGLSPGENFFYAVSASPPAVDRILLD